MRARVLGVLVILSALLCASSARAASITFEPVFDPVTNQLSLDVSILDVASLLGPTSDGTLAEGIWAFTFDVAFNDDSFLGTSPQFSVLDGGFLSALGQPTSVGGFIDPILNVLTVSGAILGITPSATMDGSLASLVFFNVNGDLVPVVQNVQLARLLQGGDVPFDLVTDLPVSPVPEPSTLALLGIGLAAMARKKLKRQTLG